MSGDVTEVDFGKSRRDAARMFERLFRLVEGQAEAVLTDPLPFLSRANQQIAELRRGISEARDALRAPAACYVPDNGSFRDEPLGTVVVEKDRYERLLACARLVEKLDDS